MVDKHPHNAPAFVLKSAVLANIKPTSQLRYYISHSFNIWLPCVIVSWPVDTLTDTRTKIRVYANTKEWKYTIDVEVPTISIILNSYFTRRLGPIPLSCWPEYKKLKLLVHDIQSLQEIQ